MELGQNKLCAPEQLVPRWLMNTCKDCSGYCGMSTALRQQSHDVMNMPSAAGLSEDLVVSYGSVQPVCSTIYQTTN